MTATDATTDLTDPELISRVRDGDVTAYGALFSRHVDAATRLARMLVNGPDADDLVSEAFVKVLNVLLAGGGPDVAFRAYLLTAVRRLHVDKIRSTQKAMPTGDLTPFDPGVPFTDTAVAGFEGGAAAKAFASLPERWQLVLWHLEVENQKPADIAPLLGMSANSVSALAYRAREGLRQAFLNMHSGDLVDAGCRQTHDLLGSYVRGGLAKRDSTRVEEHLDHCRRCTGVYLELTEVNSSLSALLGPAVLGAAAAAYLGGGAAVTGGAGAGVLVALGRARDFVLANGPASAATAGVVGVAAATAVVVGVRAPDPTPTADPPTAASTQSATGDPSLTDKSVAVVPRQAHRRAARPLTPVRSSSPSATASASADPSTATASETPQSQQDPATTTPHDPGKKPDPTPDTPKDPTPDPPSNPPKDPPSDPPSDPPADPPTVDVSVSVDAGGVVSGRFTMTAHVRGVPSGATAILTVRSDKGSLRSSGAGCSGSDKRFTCQATAARTSFGFSVTNSSRPRISFTVAAPSGVRDTSSGNNSTSLQAPGGHTPGGGGASGGTTGGTKGGTTGGSTGGSSGGSTGGTKDPGGKDPGKGTGKGTGKNPGKHGSTDRTLVDVVLGLL